MVGSKQQVVPDCQVLLINNKNRGGKWGCLTKPSLSTISCLTKPRISRSVDSYNAHLGAFQLPATEMGCLTKPALGRFSCLMKPGVSHSINSCSAHLGAFLLPATEMGCLTQPALGRISCLTKGFVRHPSQAPYSMLPPALRSLRKADFR